MRPALFIGLFVLAACAPGAGGPPATADHGPYPTNYERIIQADLVARLKDPDSLRDLTIEAPTRYKRFRGLVFGGGYWRGWASCVGFNAKNSFGGYTGVTWHTALLRDGHVVEWVDLCG